MTDGAPSLSWVADGALRVGFGEQVDAPTLATVRAAWARLAARPPEHAVDVTSAYLAVLVTFDPLRVEPDAAESAVRSALAEAPTPEDEPGGATLRTLEVCRCLACAPDLAEAARRLGCTPEHVVAQHASPTYCVQFLGFAPGFPYLVGLPEALALPRHATPRARVPAGSVAVAGGQAGIYPQDLPGGWWLLGRTGRRLFHAERFPPARLAPGDRVRFEPARRCPSEDGSA